MCNCSLQLQAKLYKTNLNKVKSQLVHYKAENWYQKKLILRKDFFLIVDTKLDTFNPYILKNYTNQVLYI